MFPKDSLTAIETVNELKQLAQQLNLPCGTFAEACRVDTQLRKSGTYYVPNALLHVWFPPVKQVSHG